MKGFNPFYWRNCGNLCTTTSPLASLLSSAFSNAPFVWYISKKYLILQRTQHWFKAVVSKSAITNDISDLLRVFFSMLLYILFLTELPAVFNWWNYACINISPHICKFPLNFHPHQEIINVLWLSNWFIFIFISFGIFFKLFWHNKTTRDISVL